MFQGFRFLQFTVKVWNLKFQFLFSPCITSSISVFLLILMSCATSLSFTLFINFPFIFHSSSWILPSSFSTSIPFHVVSSLGLPTPVIWKFCCWCVIHFLYPYHSHEPLMWKVPLTARNIHLSNLATSILNYPLRPHFNAWSLRHCCWFFPPVCHGDYLHGWSYFRYLAHFFVNIVHHLHCCWSFWYHMRFTHCGPIHCKEHSVHLNDSFCSHDCEQ